MFCQHVFLSNKLTLATFIEGKKGAIRENCIDQEMGLALQTLSYPFPETVILYFLVKSSKDISVNQKTNVSIVTAISLKNGFSIYDNNPVVLHSIVW